MVQLVQFDLEPVAASLQCFQSFALPSFVIYGITILLGIKCGCQPFGLWPSTCAESVITYSKGAALLRMLEAFMESRRAGSFRAGVKVGWGE